MTTTSTPDVDAGSGGHPSERSSAIAGPTSSRSTERVLWWVAFGILTFGAIAMLGLWN